MKLNIGCGRTRIPGFLGVDAEASPTVDIVWDLTKTPWPFEAGSVEEIYASHVLEHLAGYDLGRVMREIYRVLRSGGFLHLRVPYGLDGLYDAYHMHAFNESTLDAFTSESSSLQWGRLFERVEVVVHRVYRFQWHLENHLPPLGRFLHDRIGRRYELEARLRKLG